MLVTGIPFAPHVAEASHGISWWSSSSHQAFSVPPPPPKLIPKLVNLERVFRSPPMTRELVRAIASFHPISISGPMKRAAGFGRSIRMAPAGLNTNC